MQQSLNVAAPWGLSHYITLNGFHPLYRALFDHAPENVSLSSWDNVKLHRRFHSDVKIREIVLSEALTEKELSGRLGSASIAGMYQEYFWPPNRVLTRELAGEIEFHHTAPFPSLHRPFVLHCEMFAPIWFPFSLQGSGRLERAGEIREHYRTIFANPLCLGIFSHVPETLCALRQFFSDPNIDNKLFHSRIGLSAKAVSDPALPSQSSLQYPRFLFVNSANQNPSNFFRRGGHIVLRFWKEYLAEGRSGLLMLRCTKPSDEDLAEYGVDVSFLRSQTGRTVIWGQDYLANHEMNALMSSAHFFLLPSASLHSVSIMQAMTLGAIPVVTDTIGTSVYVTDSDTGIVLEGMREAIWHRDASTGILVDTYSKTPDIDIRLVSQLIHRVGVLLDTPNAYQDMRHRMLAYGCEQFSGQAFSNQFWSTVGSLYQRHPKPARIGVAISGIEKPSFFDCMLRSNDWSRVFESPTQPMRRVNTGHCSVWELGGALIQAYGNPRFELSDWSVLARYFRADAPSLTFVRTLEELGGSYLSYSGPLSGNVVNESIAWMSRVLKPYPLLHRIISLIWRRIYRYHRYFVLRQRRPELSDFDIELVHEGISGYNIIRHINRYYAIPQSEGAFMPDKVEAGGYSSCFSGYSIDEVECAIVAAHDSKLLQTNSCEQPAIGSCIRD